MSDDDVKASGDKIMKKFSGALSKLAEVEEVERLVEELKAERARSLKLLNAAKRSVEDQGDLMFDVQLVEAIAEYEASRV